MGNWKDGQCEDEPKEGEGRLVLTFGDRQSIQIGEMRLHLHSIKASGEVGGKREVRLIIVGPKSIPITRLKR